MVKYKAGVINIPSKEEAAFISSETVFAESMRADSGAVYQGEQRQLAQENVELKEHVATLFWVVRSIYRMRAKNKTYIEIRCRSTLEYFAHLYRDEEQA